MLHIREAVVVEGRYDQIRLRSVLDGLILETNGFGIFRDRAQLELLRRLAQTQGLLVLTDSDSAGFLIRDYLTGALREGRVLHAYIPEIRGREPRKSVPGKEGLLGVEGMDTNTLLRALRDAGATVWDDEADAPAGTAAEPAGSAGITRWDLYQDGLTGGEHSAMRRQALLLALGLPTRLSTSRLLQVLNRTLTKEAYKQAVASLPPLSPQEEASAPQPKGSGRSAD